MGWAAKATTAKARCAMPSRDAVEVDTEGAIDPSISSYISPSQSLEALAVPSALGAEGSKSPSVLSSFSPSSPTTIPDPSPTSSISELPAPVSSSIHPPCASAPQSHAPSLASVTILRCRHLKKDGVKKSSLRALKRYNVPLSSADCLHAETASGSVATSSAQPVAPCSPHSEGLACTCVTCGALFCSPEALKEHSESTSHHVSAVLASNDEDCVLVCVACVSKSRVSPPYFGVATPVIVKDSRLPDFLESIKEWVSSHDMGALREAVLAEELQQHQHRKKQQKQAELDAEHGEDKDEVDKKPKKTKKSKKKKAASDEDEEGDGDGNFPKGKGRKGRKSKKVINNEKETSSKKSTKRSEASSSPERSGANVKAQSLGGAAEYESGMMVVSNKKTSQSKSQQKHKYKPDGQLFGISNVGNSCFLNSVLQVLAHSPGLLHDVDIAMDDGEEQAKDQPELDMSFTESVGGILNAVLYGTVVDHGRRIGKKRKGKRDPCSGKALHNDAWSDNEGSKSDTEYPVPPAHKRPVKRVHPGEVLGQIMLRAPQLGGYGQQDAHELLVEVLRALEEDEKALVTSQKESMSAPHDGTVSSTKVADAKQNFTTFQSYVWRNLSTEVTREVKCLNCGNTSRRTEESVVTSLDVPDLPNGRSAKLSDCLDQIQAETRLLVADDNGLECDKCSRENPSTSVPPPWKGESHGVIQGEGSPQNHPSSSDEPTVEDDNNPLRNSASADFDRPTRGHSEGSDIIEDDIANQFGSLNLNTADNTNICNTSADEQDDGVDGEDCYLSDDSDPALSDDTSASRHERSAYALINSQCDQSEDGDSNEFGEVTCDEDKAMLSTNPAVDSDDSGPENDANMMGAVGATLNSAPASPSKPLVTKRDAVIRDTLSRAPPVFILHLKRFQTTFSKGMVRTHKVKTHVRVSEYEDFTFAGETVKYRLYGVVCHRGAGLNRGHYISYTRALVLNTGQKSEEDETLFQKDRVSETLHEVGKAGDSIAPTTPADVTSCSADIEKDASNIAGEVGTSKPSAKEQNGQIILGKEHVLTPTNPPLRTQWWFASDAQVRPVARDQVLEDEAYLLFFEKVSCLL